MPAVPVRTVTAPAEHVAVSSAAVEAAVISRRTVSLSIPEQLRVEKEKKKSKYSGHSYIAYFQAYTNTYGPLEVLEKAFTQALTDPEVKMLSIATVRTVSLRKFLTSWSGSPIKPVWIELGLQTIHESTAEFIRRGYPLPVFEEALKKLRALGLSVIVHTILYLPGESEADMLETIEYLNRQDIQGIKLQLLHVLKDTDLYDYYLEHPFFLPTMEEYLEFLGTCLCCLRPDIVIHRLTGDGPKSLLAAPLWTGNKRLVLNQMEKSFRERDIWQGKHYHAL